MYPNSSHIKTAVACLLVASISLSAAARGSADELWQAMPPSVPQPSPPATPPSPPANTLPARPSAAQPVAPQTIPPPASTVPPPATVFPMGEAGVIEGEPIVGPAFPGAVFSPAAPMPMARPRPRPQLSFFTWQVLPDGLLYPAYLAGGRESRFASQWLYERDKGWLWDIALGGRVGLLRYGSRDAILPQGIQLDIEGAAFPRLTLDDQRDLVSADFRFGVPLTFRRGAIETKLAYYHLSSHLGDEYWLKNRDRHRINYSRDVLVYGVAVRPSLDWRLYAEAGYGFYTSGGSKPWEFQFGIDYSTPRPTGLAGAPFFAINGRIREEVDFGGNLTVQTGWQWRGDTGHLFRTGFSYFNGKTDQYEFFTEHEEQFALGIWYDY